jgi:penicillin G amidase
MIRWFFAGLLILLIISTGGLYLYLRSSLPQPAGHLTLAGPQAEIRIERDAAGVPTIFARDDADAAFGLGFVHAQDRLFQMELMRRYGAGRLSEVFGPQALPVDKEMRVLGLYRAAAAEIPDLSPAVNRDFAAYAAGVNAFLKTRGDALGALPSEFLLLRFAPQPWHEADSLVWGKLMDLQLEGNFRDELLRARLAKTISAADLAFLYPEYPEDAPTTLAMLRPLYRRLAVGRLYDAMPPAIGPIYESNEWVVDGHHSRSGKPLLANDPHLPLAAPGAWYLARIETPEGEIAGATAPGVPLVVIGHNDHIAWGFTTTTSDVEDLFIEKIDPADPDRYLTPQGSAAFQVRHETIRVRGKAPIDIAVRTTRHGPVLSDVLPPGTTHRGYALALAATFLVPHDRSAQALWRVDRAEDWPSFKAAFEDFAGPPQNVVYADTRGTIGFIAPGLVPIRKSGEGWMPMPGWTGDYDWTGFIPFAQLPALTNPPTGEFINANNKIVPASYPYFLSRDWDLPDRALRIAALLAATPMQTPASSAAIEADNYSLMAAQLVPLMTGIEPADAASRQAIDILLQWNFHMDRDEVAPLLFTAWLRQFSRAVLFGRFGDPIADYWNLRPRVMRRVLTERPGWCANPKRSGRETCATRLAEALDAALAELRKAYGNDMSKWRWGRAHVAIFANPVFSRIPVLRDWVDLSIPTSGAFDTIDHFPSDIRNDKAPFVTTFGAGLRIITDLATPRDSRMIVVPGQSGNPLSRHFADLLRRWRDFGWLFPDNSPPAARLVLVPAR